VDFGEIPRRLHDRGPAEALVLDAIDRIEIDPLRTFVRDGGGGQGAAGAGVVARGTARCAGSAMPAPTTRVTIAMERTLLESRLLPRPYYRRLRTLTDL
jgi:hypothetical protein